MARDGGGGVKLPLARNKDGQVVSSASIRTLGFAGRSKMIRLWDAMDADQQDQLLLAAEGILARGDEVVIRPEGDGPLIRTGKR
ncbi:MAG: hypothetical protein JWR00_294 [Rubritepida sp.]|nr:hypothetical protein [Rubritepida sp.]